MSDPFLVEMAKPQPDPGGGAAAAHGALIGLALLEKVFHLEYDRINPINQAPESWDIKREALRSLFRRIESLREEDRQIYPRLIKEKGFQGNPKALPGIIEDSITIPLQIMEGAIEGLTLLSWVGDRCKKILKADLLVAAELLGAALGGAFHIGQANLSLALKFSIPRDFERELRDSMNKGANTLRQIKSDLNGGTERKTL
jgi:formiminotetrahydrofolate cyclodeaminase